MEAYQGDPINGFTAQYSNASWQYRRRPVGAQGEDVSGTQQSGETGVVSGQLQQSGQGQPQIARAADVGPDGFDPLVRSLLPPGPAERDETL